MVVVMNKVKNFVKSTMVTVTMVVEPTQYTVINVHNCVAKYVLTGNVVGNMETVINVRMIVGVIIVNTHAHVGACNKVKVRFAALQLTERVSMTALAVTMGINVIEDAAHFVT